MSHTRILPSNPDWKQHYQSTIVELDAAQLPLRVAEARTAMLDRAKEIFDRTGDDEFHALCNGLLLPTRLSVDTTLVSTEMDRATEHYLAGAETTSLGV
jgi:hypothetical protein